MPLRCLFFLVFGCPLLSAQMVCAPSTPVAIAGETIRLYAWADSAQPVYAWTVSSGDVRPAGGNIFTWKFGPRSLGPNSADGELRSGSTVEARCLAEVQVIAARSAAIDSGLLLPSAAEPSGAGIYNYLLASDPKPEVFRSAAKAWLVLNSPVAELRGLLKPKESIALELPVLEKPSGGPQPDWLLQHYDFARARTLLDRALPAGKRGIYVVSSLQPLAESKPPYLVQDLSAITPELAASWVEAFINEAAQEHTWNPAEEASLVDQLRATVLSLAKESPAIKLPLLMKWIALL